MSNGQIFVLLIVSISMIGWMVSNWIRARHGYPVTDDWGKAITRDNPEADRKIALLTTENETLTGKVLRLEERISVLERIATDQPNRLSAEIENLR